MTTTARDADDLAIIRILRQFPSDDRLAHCDHFRAVYRAGKVAGEARYLWLKSLPQEQLMNVMNTLWYWDRNKWDAVIDAAILAAKPATDTP